ncbi:MAG: sulfite exporter TauE/SafE family protein [Cytophagales bacterium]|nr:sulfite exporter TauE/SafE family protein [Bernardetiaceae bacterium]MDW8209790.1 sulfite exporter TauE/SafE family protein [Cytophagales bacterium]
MSLYEVGLYLLLLLAGAFAGFINTLTGSGSVVTIAALIFAGLPANIANGTNRLGVMVQTSVGMLTFARHGRAHVKGSEWFIIPAVIGGMLGAWVATQTSGQVFERWLGFVMVLMLFIILYKPQKWLRQHSQAEQQRTLLNLLVFFGVGFYGGFIQAGIGIFLMIALVLLAKFNLQETTILKLSVVFFINIPSLLIFIYYGQVEWVYGSIMAIGQSIGANLAARFALKSQQAALWTYRLLVAVVLLSIWELFDLGEYTLKIFTLVLT